MKAKVTAKWVIHLSTNLCWSSSPVLAIPHVQLSAGTATMTNLHSGVTQD